MVIYSPGGTAGGSSTKETNRGRKAALSGADLYCTPPWVTRALLSYKFALGEINRSKKIWEPACGLGHMSDVLREDFDSVYASDINDYGYGDIVDFINCTKIPSETPDIIITNPPFRLALEFALRAIEIAPRVALLCRTQWLEGQERNERLFNFCPPSRVIVFSERVSGMHAGKWDPDTSGGVQSYSWFVWDQPLAGKTQTELFWFPPGCREMLTMPDDVKRFAHRRTGTITDLEPMLPFESQSPVEGAGPCAQDKSTKD